MCHVIFVIVIVLIPLIWLLYDIDQEDQKLRVTCQNACAAKRLPTKCEQACWRSITSDDLQTPEQLDYN